MKLGEMKISVQRKQFGSISTYCFEITFVYFTHEKMIEEIVEIELNSQLPIILFTY